METSQSLSIESFSYSWLVDLKPSLDNSPDGSFRASLDVSDEASFIEMDPKLSPSKRFFIVHQDLNFDFPVLQSPLSLVHADELISNGILVPVFFKPLKMEEAYDSSSDSIPSTPESSPTKENIRLFRRIRCSSLRRYKRFSKRVLQKYLDLFRPIYQRIKGRKSRMQGMNSWGYSAATSPRSSVAYSVDNWRRSCDSESSIYEAVLHCKRTIGNEEAAV